MASKSKANNPQDYTGPRQVIKTKNTVCGWCNSNSHESCKHELAYYDKLWICSCDCNKDWVPQDLNNQEPMNGSSKNEVRTLPVPGETGQPTEASDSPGDLSSGELDEGDSSVEGLSDNSDDEPSGE